MFPPFDGRTSAYGDAFDGSDATSAYDYKDTSLEPNHPPSGQCLPPGAPNLSPIGHYSPVGSIQNYPGIGYLVSPSFVPYQSTPGDGFPPSVPDFSPSGMYLQVGSIRTDPFKGYHVNDPTVPYQLSFEGNPPLSGNQPQGSSVEYSTQEGFTNHTYTATNAPHMSPTISDYFPAPASSNRLGPDLRLVEIKSSATQPISQSGLSEYVQHGLVLPSVEQQAIGLSEKHRPIPQRSRKILTSVRVRCGNCEGRTSPVSCLPLPGAKTPICTLCDYQGLATCNLQAERQKRKRERDRRYKR